MISLRTSRKAAVGERCDAIYARGLTHASAVEMRHFPTDAWRLGETYCNARWTSTCKKAGSGVSGISADPRRRAAGTDRRPATPSTRSHNYDRTDYEATLTRHRKDDLKRELPLLVVAQGIQILLARELDHGRRAAHDD